MLLFRAEKRRKDSGVTALAYSNSLDSLVAATLLQIAFFDVSTGTILRTIDRSTSSPALLLKMESHGLILTSKGRVSKLMTILLSFSFEE